MNTAVTFAEAESKFIALLESKPLPVMDLLALIHSTTVKNNSQDESWTNVVVQELIDAGDFTGLYTVVKSCASALVAQLGVDGILTDLERACKDRMVLAFIETVPFTTQPLEDSFHQLDTLLSLAPGAQVIDKTWGFGTVKRLDHFYKRVTIDFSGKRGHHLTFKTASETLIPAAHDHILTIHHNNPSEIERLINEQPGEVVKGVLRCFGAMPIPKLESTLVDNNVLTSAAWKGFWDNARKALKSDPLVVVPSKRTECIELLAEAASYDDRWFSGLRDERDPQLILNAVLELEELKKIATMDEAQRELVSSRLGFAIKGAHNTNPALYVKLVTLCDRHSITPDVFKPDCEESIEPPHIHLWGSDRFMQAAQKLTVKDVSNMVAFLLQQGPSAREKLLAALPGMPYNLLNETLLALRETEEAAQACRELLMAPKAAPTLVSWIFRYRAELSNWNLPPLLDLLHHAIITVETNLNGENLRMQNGLKKLFKSAGWLKEIFDELTETQRHLLFERIQASPAWDPTTQRALLARMLKLDPTLADRKRATSSTDEPASRLTSWRSFVQRQALYKKLVESDLPKNSNDIAVARSYGDLRENFEYQAAKDYQRQLLQKQSEMQLELELVRGSDFANISTAKVAPGTTVELLIEDGVKKSYTILGEWDRDEELDIISNKTRMAECLLGKSAGDKTTIPVPGGEKTAEILAVSPLSQAITDWIASPPESTT
ncbi:MAG: GreA/GreB family elongation factor [Kiritimatiellae bacterium]|nr:GreA/GreB family elongation factor [Kiritimatiellia bacterium]